MKTKNENMDKEIDKLAASTRSPRGRFTAEHSWKLLEERLHKSNRQRLFWLRAASSAAVVLLCVASWAAYQAMRTEPFKKSDAAPMEQAASAPVAAPEVLVFHEQPLHQVAQRLSQVYGVPIRIDDESLRNYRMTATFSTNQKLPQIIELLQKASETFTHTTLNDTIIITKLH